MSAAEETTADIAVNRVWLTKKAHYIGVDCCGGECQIPIESLQLKNQPLFQIKIVRNLVGDALVPRDIVAEVEIDGKRHGPVATSTGATGSVNFCASSIGASYKGDFGKRLYYLDQLLQVSR